MNKSKIIQLGMDGPNVNQLVLTKMQAQREEEELSLLEDIGSCGLHVISSAFQTGMQCTGWDIDKILCAMFVY